MSYQIWTNISLENASKIINLPYPSDELDAANKGYVDSAVEGLSWKTAVNVASESNINIASAPSTINGVTLSSLDRILLYNQSSPSQNGIYIFDSVGQPLVRSLDANTFDELNQAVVSVLSGSLANTTFRQTVPSNGTKVIDVDANEWTVFGTSAPSASESTAGVAEISTQSETNNGEDDSKFITPLKLKNYNGFVKKYSTTIGDGSATSYTITHNLNTTDVVVEIFYNSGSRKTILASVERPTSNTVVISFDPTPPALNQFRLVITG